MRTEQHHRVGKADEKPTNSREATVVTNGEFIKLSGGPDMELRRLAATPALDA
jgi:hypothetical protein